VDLIGEGIVAGHGPHGRFERIADIAVVGADKGVAGVQPGVEHLPDARTRHVAMRSLFPDDRQLLDGALGLPPSVCDDRDSPFVDLHHLSNASP
jgi:hypothetical protein